MYKKIKIAALLLLPIISASITANSVFAYTDVEQKALGYGIYRCYNNATTEDGKHVLVGEISLQNVTSYTSVILDNSWEYVPLPTGFSSLHNINDNNVSCRQLFGGWDILGAGGTFDGLFERAGLSELNNIKNDSQRKQLLNILGYSVSSSTSGKCFKLKNYTIDAKRNKNTSVEMAGICSNTGKSNSSDIFLDGTSINDLNKITLSGDTLTLSLYTGRYNEGYGGYKWPIYEDKKYSLSNYSSFDDLANTVINDFTEYFVKKPGDFYCPKHEGNAVSTTGATVTYQVCIDGANVVEWYELENTSKTGSYTIASTRTSDNRAKASYKAANNLLGSSFNAVKDIAFNAQEEYSLYKTYFNDYYAATLQCDYGSGKSATESSLISDGYYKIEKGTLSGCYAKPTKNAGGSVYGLNNDKYFDGTTFIFKELINAYSEGAENANISKEDIENGTDNTVTSTNDDTDPCYNAGVEGMSWILCPAINNMASSVDWLDGIMRDWFSIDANVTFQDSTRSVWGTFRNIANALLIIVLLLIIFSQLTGVGIDNYGIKKMLPRLIVMGVLINLSYVICELAVDLSNILGVGLDNLFRSIGASAYQGYSGGEFVMNLIKDIFFAIGVAGSTAGLGITIASIASGGGIAVVISLVLVLLIALVAVLMFFLMLGARMVIVIIFTVIAPVAFACYILPNTQGLFKQWWKVFKAALIIFPIAGALYGASYIIRGIVYSGGEVQFWMALVAVFAPFLPFLLLPTLLRSAIAALGMVGGALSAMSNGLRKGLSGANSAVKSTEAYKEGQKEAARRMQGNRAQRIVNRLNKRAADNNGELSARNQRRLARSYGILDKQRREDNAARTIMAEKEFKGKSERELKEAWTDAYLGENLPRLDALTNLLNSRQGPKAASWMASQIYSNGARENSLAALRDNMAHSPGFDKNMSKSFDAYAMIKGAGKDSEGTSQAMSYFSRTNSMVDDEAGWAGQNKNAIMRAVQNGNAMLSKDMIGRILTSTNPDIQSSLSEEKRKVLQAAYYMKDNGMSGTMLTDANVDDYARRYQERYATPGQQPSGNPEPSQPAGDSGSGAPEGGTEA